MGVTVRRPSDYELDQVHFPLESKRRIQKKTDLLLEFETGETTTLGDGTHQRSAFELRDE